MTTNIEKEAKTAQKAQNAPQRKAVIETVKTVLIIALVVGFLAFMLGIHYQQHIDTSKQEAVNAAVKTAQLTVKH